MRRIETNMTIARKMRSLRAGRECWQASACYAEECIGGIAPLFRGLAPMTLYAVNLVRHRVGSELSQIVAGNGVPEYIGSQEPFGG